MWSGRRPCCPATLVQLFLFSQSVHRRFEHPPAALFPRVSQWSRSCTTENMTASAGQNLCISFQVRGLVCTRRVMELLCTLGGGSLELGHLTIELRIELFELRETRVSLPEYTETREGQTYVIVMVAPDIVGELVAKHPPDLLVRPEPFVVVRP